MPLTTFGEQFAFWVDEKEVFQILFYGKLGVVRVLTSQLGFTRPSSIYFSLGIVRNIVPLVIHDIRKDFNHRRNLRTLVV